MSLIPMGGNKPSPNPWLAANYPASLLTMGLTAERVARHYGISRDDQDAFALASHQKALAAQAAGRFAEELVPVSVTICVAGQSSRGKPHVQEKEFSADEGPRADTSAEALAQLKPVFHAQGTVTAGNSSQTSDGAAAAVLMESGRARSLGIQPLARLVSYAVTGCLPEEMGVGPITAIPKALAHRRPHSRRHRPDRIERSLRRAGPRRHSRSRPGPGANQRQRRRHRSRPSARLHRRQIYRNAAPRDESAASARYGMVTMCVGGGMGAAGIFELLALNFAASSQLTRFLIPSS